jgi:hypothetical protein
LSRDGLLVRIGAISQMAGVEYWSTTQQQWRTLIIEAHATSSQGGEQRRPDFSADELAAGRPVFFLQQDSTFGQGVYRLRVREAAADHIVCDTSNASALRMMLFPIIEAGGIESVTFLDRDSKELWRYYNLTRTKSMNPLIAGHAASLINRAAAIYRYVAGLPADKSHPDAR